MSFIASKIPNEPVTVYDEIKDFRSTDDTLLASCDADWKEVANKLIVGVNKDLIKNINTLVSDAEVEKKRVSDRCRFIWNCIKDAYHEHTFTDKLVFILVSYVADKNYHIDKYTMNHFVEAARNKGYSPQLLRDVYNSRITFTLICKFD